MMGERFANRGVVRNYRPSFPREVRTEGRMGMPRENFSRDTRTEGRMGKPKETLAGRMERLGIEILPDSGVGITFVVLNSEKWAGLGTGEKKEARKATKELRRAPMSAGRARKLVKAALPLADRPVAYPNLRSALRAVGEHIPKSKKIERKKILELIVEIKTVIRRIDETKGRVGAQELGAKLRKLGGIAENLGERNRVWLVDQHADLAKDIIPEAIGLLEEGKWYVACPKLVAVMNILNEKLEHDRGEVLTKNSERARLLEEIIMLRGERNTRIRECLEGIRTEDVENRRHGLLRTLIRHADSLKNSNETVLIEVKNGLAMMCAFMSAELAERFMSKREEVLSLLKKADEMAG